VFAIGEFSKITGLTIKTLRFYHEKEILVPAGVDPETGYRYYDARQIDKARIIAQLRGLEFSLDQIREVLISADDEGDILDYLERQKATLQEKSLQWRHAAGALDRIIRKEKEALKIMRDATFTIEEKVLNTLLIAGIRMKGRYSDSGQAFAKIGKAFGWHISGNCFMLHYDTEYKEDDADFEVCMPIRKAQAVAGISVRELPGCRCLALLHKGPYDELSRSYAKILTSIKEKGHEIVMPTREVYIKGPGMIFKGNPRNYLTEIQIPFKAG
jgi:DNA-binding transcriptional MerR regulator/effector-binding domain-containing protein